MKLEIGEITIKDVTLADETALNDGHLTINKQDLIDIVLKMTVSLLLTSNSQNLVKRHELHRSRMSLNQDVKLILKVGSSLALSVK